VTDNVADRDAGQETPTDSELWPAVDAAFDFVLPFYQLLAGRFEAADTRLTALLTFTSTLTLAVPIFAKNVQPNISFKSPVFILGMATFLAGAIVGMIGRVTGSLALPDPMLIYHENLNFLEWEFKKNQIYFAGQNFDYNIESINRKGTMAILMSVALLIEVSAFVLWIVI
jgi:hypothetical protein